MNEVADPPKPRNGSRRKAAALLIVISLLAVVVVVSALALSTLKTGRYSISSVGASSSTVDRLDVFLLARDVDTARQEAKFRLYVEPAGAYADDNGKFAEDIEIDTSSEASGDVLVAKKGLATSISEFVSSFETGDEAAFPFDRYGANVWLTASTKNGEAVPLRVQFEASDSMFRFKGIDASAQGGETSAEDAQYEPALRINIERSGLTKIVAIVILLLMWAMAIAVAAVTWMTLAQDAWRQRSFEILAWHSALLFALIQLRGTTPGIPAFGTLFDFVGFFWAELIVAISLCIVVFVLVTSHVPLKRRDSAD